MTILIDEPHVRDGKRVARDGELPRAFAGYDTKSFRTPGKRSQSRQQHDAEQRSEAASHDVVPSSGRGDRSVRRKRRMRISAPVTTRPAPIAPTRS